METVSLGLDPFKVPDSIEPIRNGNAVDRTRPISPNDSIEPIRNGNE